MFSKNAKNEKLKKKCKIYEKQSIKQQKKVSYEFN